MLAYVAAGRLIAYSEEHMNAWDCLAAMLLIEEAGGIVEPPDPPTVLENGTIVIAGGKGVFDKVRALCRARLSACNQHRARDGKADADRLARLKRRIDIGRNHENLAEFRADDEFEMAADIGDLFERAGERFGRVRLRGSRSGSAAPQVSPVPDGSRAPAVSTPAGRSHRSDVLLHRRDLAVEDIGLADEVGDEARWPALVEVARRAVLRNRPHCSSR